MRLCRELEEIIRPFRAHCALTGSCLYKGESEKDVDIIIYSHQKNNDPYNKDEILKAMADSGFITAGIPPYQTTPNYLDKDVVLIDNAGQRIDLFFFP